MFTEYVRGGELRTYLSNKRKPFTEEEAKKLLRILVDAIEYIHSHNIVHRDIKLENILLNDSKNPYDIKIIDFGISGLLSDIGGDNIHAGTMAYSPPEIISKANLASSPKIDIWGLGVVLYLLLTKRFPFYGENDYLTFQSIIKDDLKFPKSLPLSKQVRELLHGMLSKKPMSRYSLEEVKRHPWLVSNPNPSSDLFALKNDLESVSDDSSDYYDDDKSFLTKLTNNSTLGGKIQIRKGKVKVNGKGRGLKLVKERKESDDGMVGVFKILNFEYWNFDFEYR